MTNSNKLSIVEDLLRNDQTSAAMQLLERCLKESPRDINGWWLGGQYAPKRETRVQCLKRVLKLDPKHAGAKEALDLLLSEESNSGSANPVRSLEPSREAPKPEMERTIAKEAECDVELISEYAIETGASAEIVEPEEEFSPGEYGDSPGEYADRKTRKKTKSLQVEPLEKGKKRSVAANLMHRLWIALFGFRTLNVLIAALLCFLSYRLHRQMSELSEQTTEAVRVLTTDLNGVKKSLSDHHQFSMNISTRHQQLESQNEQLRRELNNLRVSIPGMASRTVTDSRPISATTPSLPPPSNQDAGTGGGEAWRFDRCRRRE